MLSTVIPVYNEAATVAEVLGVVLAQPPVKEVVIVDDCSSDGSWDVPAGTSENEGVVGRNKIYWTAMASLVLEVYLHYLPAYQR